MKYEITLDYLIGKTIVSADGRIGDSELVLRLSDGKSLKMLHEQECCEQVYLSDVTGDWGDILGIPVMDVYENTNEYWDSEDWDSEEYMHRTYTFYTIVTFRGAVTLRWNGKSNGYYSESVDLVVCQ